MDSSESLVYGEQEGVAYNGRFEGYLFVSYGNELDGSTIVQPLSQARLQTPGGRLWQSLACSFFLGPKPRKK
jgi:hypothetical protein